MNKFKEQHPFERRVQEANRIKDKYPDRVPVIVEKTLKCTLPDLSKKKYLVPSDLTLGQFAYVIRKNLRLTPEQAIFIFTEGKGGDVLPPMARMMSTLYDEHCAEDGFLYLYYAAENTFGQ